MNTLKSSGTRIHLHTIADHFSGVRKMVRLGTDDHFPDVRKMIGIDSGNHFVSVNKMVKRGFGSQHTIKRQSCLSCLSFPRRGESKGVNALSSNQDGVEK
ncbi:hypothetical protein [Vreelandella alkaliphila]|uniref:Uncharacterized protein n=1 Tax=Vreelandella alkaliphila TaxID=272774 RepID=A0A7C9K6A4_9GAMM|nr:hypothetical protein [Halomonas alkaliphila]NDL70299.1 hypothetical protein [Halomonas alkaliphila]